MLFGLLALGKLALTVYDWHTDRREEKESRREERRERVRAVSKRRRGLGSDPTAHGQRMSEAATKAVRFAEEAERYALKGKCNDALDYHEYAAAKAGAVKAESVSVSTNNDELTTKVGNALSDSRQAVRACYAKWR